MNFFITGHAEYDPYSLKSEYDRDIKAGMDMHIPINYYPDDDPTKRADCKMEKCS